MSFIQFPSRRAIPPVASVIRVIHEYRKTKGHNTHNRDEVKERRRFSFKDSLSRIIRIIEDPYLASRNISAQELPGFLFLGEMDEDSRLNNS